MVYSKTHQFEWNFEDCSSLSRMKSGLLRNITAGQRHFLKLWSSYDSVREVFWNLLATKSTDSTGGITGKLKKIVNILTDNNDYDYKTMNLFLAMTDKKTTIGAPA